MTTNAGAAELAKEPVGFEQNQRQDEDTEAINRLFSPEFRNRLDAIVPFETLSENVIGQVVDKFVM
jgi:ATP-dependent Clp protease ATP-binding subunit ClpA